MIPGLSTAKLIALAIAAAAILSFVALAFHWRDTMTSRGKELGTICAATRAAADNPKLDCKLVAQQIGELGKSVDALKGALASQNAAVNALAAESAREQQNAARASQEAAQRAKRPQQVSDSLAASARAPERSSAPCQASKALVGAWK